MSLPALCTASFEVVEKYMWDRISALKALPDFENPTSLYLASDGWTADVKLYRGHVNIFGGPFLRVYVSQVDYTPPGSNAPQQLIFLHYQAVWVGIEAIKPGEVLGALGVAAQPLPVVPAFLKQYLPLVHAMWTEPVQETVPPE